MSGLAALLAGNNPPGVYQWHNATAVAGVAHAVEHAGWRFAHVDGWAFEDGESFVKATRQCLDLDPATDTIDDLDAALGQLDAAGRRGVVLLWEGWGPMARKDGAGFTSALAALTHRAAAEHGCAFAVILRGAGPDLDLPELPATPRGPAAQHGGQGQA